MKRHVLVVLVAGGSLAASACGAAPAPSAAPQATTTAPPATAVSGGRSDTTRAPADDVVTLQEQADQVLTEIFEADRDLDYRSIERLTSRAVAARYRNQELLATIEGLDPALKTPAAESVTVTSTVEVGEPEGDAVPTTGSVTATYTDADGAESSYTYTDIVFEQDGDDLLVADWRSETEALPASAAFLNTAGVDDATAGDVTVRLEPGYRDPDGDPAFVEYLFTVENGSDLPVDVRTVELTTPAGETYEIQFGVADTAAPGSTVAARVGFEGPSLPVFGGTLTVTLEDGNGDRSLALIDLPAFVDAAGDPEPARPVQLDDVTASASGTPAGGSTGTGS